MARSLHLTDGYSRWINLLSLSGIQMKHGSFLQSQTPRRALWQSSIFDEGRSLVFDTPENVIETFQVNLTGTDHDNVAAKLQELMEIVRLARQKHTTQWQRIPIFLRSQTTGETNWQCATVVNITTKMGQSFFDPPMDPGNRVNDIVIEVEREPYWRSVYPGSQPSSFIAMTTPNDPSPMDSNAWRIATNFMSPSASLSHIYNYDASGPTFSSNLFGTTLFNLFSLSAAMPAVGDMMYFGGDYPFHCIHIYLNTPSITGGAIIVNEYWDGAAWSTACGNPNWDWEGDVGGSIVVNFRGLDDWAKTTVNGVNKYWVRFRITSFSSWTQNAEVVNTEIHEVRSTYVEWSDTQIDGDVGATGILHLWGNDRDHVFTDVFMGLKSRGLTYFQGRLSPVSGINPGSWSEAKGTDTTDVTDPMAGSDGQSSECTFATNQSLVVRAQMWNGNYYQCDDFVGEYHLFLLAKQINGSAGDVSVMVRQVIQNSYTDSPTIPLTRVGDIEVVSLGRTSIYPTGVEGFTGTYQGMYGLKFEIHASSSNGSTPNLRIYELVLMPIDEWATSIGVDQSVLLLGGGRYHSHIVDNGVFRKGTSMVDQYGTLTYVIGPWETRGSLPIFPPGRQSRLYFLFADETKCYASMYAGVRFYPVERWEYLRGSS